MTVYSKVNHYLLSIFFWQFLFRNEIYLIDEDRYTYCEVIMPEYHVCADCMAGCIGCPWGDDRDNYRFCIGHNKDGDKIDRKRIKPI